MVETLKERKLPAWYLCALLHYQGDTLWSVGFCRRKATRGGLKDSWEWVENLSHSDALALIKANERRIVRCTPGDLSKIVRS